MSAYSEWKYGLITDAEYNTACRQEEDDRAWWQTPDEDEEGEED